MRGGAPSPAAAAAFPPPRRATTAPIAAATAAHLRLPRRRLGVRGALGARGGRRRRGGVEHHPREARAQQRGRAGHAAPRRRRRPRSPRRPTRPSCSRGRSRRPPPPDSALTTRACTARAPAHVPQLRVVPERLRRRPLGGRELHPPILLLRGALIFDHLDRSRGARRLGGPRRPRRRGRAALHGGAAAAAAVGGHVWGDAAAGVNWRRSVTSRPSGVAIVTGRRAPAAAAGPSARTPRRGCRSGTAAAAAEGVPRLHVHDAEPRPVVVRRALPFGGGGGSLFCGGIGPFQ